MYRELIEAVPTSANVKYYANIVSEKALFVVSSKRQKMLQIPVIWKKKVQR